MRLTGCLLLRKKSSRSRRQSLGHADLVLSLVLGQHAAGAWHGDVVLRAADHVGETNQVRRGAALNCCQKKNTKTSGKTKERILKKNTLTPKKVELNVHVKRLYGVIVVADLHSVFMRVARSSEIGFGTSQPSAARK